jgi:hypothetical protein
VAVTNSISPAYMLLHDYGGNERNTNIPKALLPLTMEYSAVVGS